jgi:hypothetical protein
MTAAAEAPEILLKRHLKKLKLPAVLREYEKLVQQCTAETVDHVRYPARLIEPAPPDREARRIDRRIRQAKVPAIKSLETFGFDAIPALNKKLVLDLARFASAAAIVRGLIEARDAKRLLRLVHTDRACRAADHRRAGLRPPVQDWRRVAAQAHQPAL